MPKQILDILYPLKNFSLPILSRLALSLFIFNEFPNRGYYDSLRDIAIEYLEQDHVSVDDIDNIIRSKIDNNLSCWRALHWSK